MKIQYITNSPNFMRKLKASEEQEYSETLRRGKELVSNGTGKSVLIIPSTSLPQLSENNTGVGNMASKEAEEFAEFAKKYWGINEFQLLPTGQYFSQNGHYPIYTSSSMDFGNHIINLKKYLTDTDFKNIVKNNNVSDSVNFENVIEKESAAENGLKALYKKMPDDLKNRFTEFKNHKNEITERKSLYKALTKIYGNYRYNDWNEIDRNLFNEDIVSKEKRLSRIEEIKKLESETIDFYKFKQFLAEDSLKDAKEMLNKKGIKLSGDLICGFSYDEVWSYPKAFLKDYDINWGNPALDVNSPDAEKILRMKAEFYAKHFDGIRLDAAWTYTEPILYLKTNSNNTLRNNYGEKFLKVIEDEFVKVKGKDYDLKNIMYEFAADSKDFNIHSYGDILKPYVDKRVKIYTSDYMSDNWGHAKNFMDRGWGDMFIHGMTNHDSPEVKPTSVQTETLSKLFGIPKEKLSDLKEFVNTKLAEPLRAKNNMIFFMQALGLSGRYKDNSDNKLDYRIKIQPNYQDNYFRSLEKGIGFNPMDALERNFRALGLDETESELYKKIVKYRDILASKKEISATRIGIYTAVAGILLLAAAAIYNSQLRKESV